MNLKLSDELISYIRKQNLSAGDKAKLLISSILFKVASDNKEIFKGENALATFSEEVLLKMIKEGLLSYSELTGYELVFNVFEEELIENTSTDKFKWVSRFRDLFKQANPDRWGTLSTCKERMKKFFSENPEVRIDEVISATAMYLKNTDRKYIMKSHKFIYDGIGTTKNSTLEEWIEKYREMLSNTQTPKDITDKLQ